MKNRHVIIAVVALVATAAVFVFTFKKGKNSSVESLDEINANLEKIQSENPSPPVMSQIPDVASALQKLDKKNLLENIDLGSEKLKDRPYIEDLREKTESNLAMKAYFSALLAVMDKDSAILDSLFHVLDGPVSRANDRSVVTPLIEDVCQKGAEAGFLELWCRMNLYRIYAERGQTMMAVPQLKAIEELDSTNVEAIYVLAKLSIQSGQLDKARDRFKKLVSLQPQNQQFRDELLSVCEKLGDSECLAEYSQE